MYKLRILHRFCRFDAIRYENDKVIISETLCDGCVLCSGFVRMTPLIISTKIKAECMQVALEMEGWYMDA